ncbi:MAG TPA: bifunctional salicylyl-CoA 5-hydroxylase/oxidoreductase [Rhodocyclaceae bacterium]
MRIVCLGGGPAGLYFSILIRRLRPDWEVTLVERSRPDDAFGWGVVFSDRTLENFRAADPVSYVAISQAMEGWDDIETWYRGQCIRSGGHGFSGIPRRRLLAILQKRAQALGVQIQFETEAQAADAYADYDLIVAADGIHSAVRQRYAERFQPQTEEGRCRYLWLGARRPLESFTFDFRETEWGWITLHAYRCDAEWSTFIVEMPEEVWQRAGIDQMNLAQSLAFCNELFADRLAGVPLEANGAHPRGGQWLRFTRLHCRRWYKDNVVLLGDAAHTAHFSIGSGTKLAMEDAIALAHHLHAEPDPARALPAYQDERESEVLRLQSAARNRQEWFENVARYATLPTPQFVHSLLTGSQRIGHASLRERDPFYAAGYEQWFAARAHAAAETPPLFTPYQLRGLTLANRIVMSPMSMESTPDGLANDFTLAHLGARALGGAGLIISEAAAISPEGRITLESAGLWNDAHTAAWRRITDFVHANSSTRIGIQLAHSGPKGAAQLPWQNDGAPLAAGWPLLSASAIPWDDGWPTPRAMERADMDTVLAQCVAAAERAEAAGFDLLELHYAHGYLFSAFLCPLSNRRQDEYGGSLENRCRYPLEVLRAVRAAWPAEKPLSVRISAHDWAPGGNTGDEALQIARLLREAGADLIDVSSGQTTPDALPRYGRMYQTPFADRIRNELDLATLAVGAITTADQANTIIAAGRADLVALGRPLLANPMWPLHAAAELGYTAAEWPAPYTAAREQHWREVARAKELRP